MCCLHWIWFYNTSPHDLLLFFIFLNEYSQKLRMVYFVYGLIDGNIIIIIIKHALKTSHIIFVRNITGTFSHSLVRLCLELIKNNHFHRTVFFLPLKACKSFICKFVVYVCVYLSNKLDKTLLESA